MILVIVHIGTILPLHMQNLPQTATSNNCAATPQEVPTAHLRRLQPQNIRPILCAQLQTCSLGLRHEDARAIREDAREHTHTKFTVCLLSHLRIEPSPTATIAGLGRLILNV